MVGRRSGFTLIEVLVVLMLTSLISLALFSSFRTGIHSVQLAEEHIRKVEDSRQLVNLLRRHMLNVVAVTLAEGGVQVDAFDGDVSRIRYVAPLSMSTYGENYLVEVVSGLDSKPGLWGRFGRYKYGLSADEIFEESEFVLLSEEVEVQISYFNRDDTGNAEWVMDWVDHLGVPDLVKLDITRNGDVLPSLTLKVGHG